ncbi:MAG: photosynthetic reaction center cytochrome c subunit [Chloroflexi bacterium]|nr:photosynthetic reaction center cytochrome c subunit [Chloroflexota bacterium]
MTPGTPKNRQPNKTWAAVAVAAVVLIVVLFVTQSLAYFVTQTVVETAAAQELPPSVYVNYYADGSYISGESNAAIAAYIAQYPEPQNVKVLTGMNTTQIWTFMTSYVAGGMQVDCTYCHNINNFAAEGAEIGDDVVATRKATAVLHLQMVADLNQNWITQLATIADKQPSGAQIICATCHNGDPLPVSWPDGLHALPDDFRLPLNNLDSLLLAGLNNQISLDTVQSNQYAMTHIQGSLGVGCTHCHNSRYFPSWEQPAKYYALTMLEMNQHILNEYSETMNNQEPSCYLCHQNQVRPPGAVTSASSLPAVLVAP